MNLCTSTHNISGERPKTKEEFLADLHKTHRIMRDHDIELAELALKAWYAACKKQPVNPVFFSAMETVGRRLGITPSISELRLWLETHKEISNE